MKVALLCHDDVAELDRRVVAFARFFATRGWEAIIVCTTRLPVPVTKDLGGGVKVQAVSARNLRATWDPGFHRLRDLPGYVADRLLTILPPVAARMARRLGGRWKRLRDRVRRSAFGEPNAEETPRIVGHPLPFSSVLFEGARQIDASLLIACDLPALPAAARLSRRNDVPLIYDSHEFYAEQVAFDDRQRQALVRQERAALAAVDLAITVSPEIAAQLSRRYPEGPEFEVIFNAPEFSVDDSRRVVARNHLGVSPGRRLAIYHGGFLRSRNLENLVDGAKRLDGDGFSLLLLGYGDADWLRCRAEGCKHIHVHSAVPQSELPAWVGDCDLCVIPYGAVDLNTRLALPNKLFDAVALGVPVLVNECLESASGLVAEYGIGWSGDLSSPHAVEATLRACLERLDTHPQMETNFSRARAELSWPRQEQHLEQWLAQLEIPGP